jgi:hypothetical protein
LREAVADDGLSPDRVLQPVPAQPTATRELAPLPSRYTTQPRYDAAAAASLADRRATPTRMMVRVQDEKPMEPPMPPMASSSGGAASGSAALAPMPNSLYEVSAANMGDDCGCGDTSCGGSGKCNWFGGKRGGGYWSAGVEFLLARPTFSEPTAFLVREGPVLTPGNVLAASDTWVYYAYSYDPTVRTPTYFEVQPGPGQTLFANQEVGGDVFDVDFARCIRTPEECDPCSCASCPAWDLQWSAGARIARWDMNTRRSASTRRRRKRSSTK